MSKPKAAKAKKVAQDEVYTLTDLDQMRVLSDPLRVRILGAFAVERTTKQVAELLGEKPTKLYHHVEALEKVGLLRRSSTRQKRGTVEKYFLAVARRFRADSGFFEAAAAGDEVADESLRGAISNIFDTTTRELIELAGRVDTTEALQEEGIITFIEIHGTKREMEEIRGRINELITWLGDPSGPSRKTNRSERYRLTLAYYPLEKGDRQPKRKRPSSAKARERKS